MKILVAALLALVSVVRADELPLAEKVVEASGLRASLENGFLQGMSSATEQLKATGGEELANAAMDVIKKFFTDNVKWEDLRPLYGKSYAAEFSETELKELLAFYESPVGKKLAGKGTALTSQASKALNEKMKDKTPALQAEVMKVVQTFIEKKKGAAK